MTLKDKLEVEIMHLPLTDDVINAIGIELEHVTEEFAMNFAQWTRDMGYCHYHSYAHSYRELIEMYKKEQNL